MASTPDTTAITFDTHRFVNRMIDAGFTAAQAEALSDEQVKLITNNLATKQDVEETRAALARNIEETRAELERSIEETKAELERSIEKTRAELEHKIEKVRADLERSIEETRADLKLAISKESKKLIKWIVTTQTVLVAIIGLLIYFS